MEYIGRVWRCTPVMPAILIGPLWCELVYGRYTASTEIVASVNSQITAIHFECRNKKIERTYMFIRNHLPVHLLLPPDIFFIILNNFINSSGIASKQFIIDD